MSTQGSESASRTRGYLVALAAAAFLSSTGILIRYLILSYHMPSLVLAFWRDFFVVLTLLSVLGASRSPRLRVPRRYLPYLAVYGLVLALFNALWTLSVALNGAAVGTVLVYSSGAFTALLARLILKEGLGWAKGLAVSLGLAGCVLVAGALNAAVWRANLVGILVGVLSGLSYAAYSLMGRSASRRGLDPWTTLLYTFAFAALFLLAGNLLPGLSILGAAGRPADMFWLGTAFRGWGVLILLAAVPTVAGFGLYNVSLSLLPSSVANLIVTLEPVFTTITAYLLLGERLTAVQLGGGAMILAGVVLMRLYEERRARRKGES